MSASATTWSTRPLGMRTVPVFVDADGALVHPNRLVHELDAYVSDIRRGVIVPTVSFAQYVERYCSWRLQGGL